MRIISTEDGVTHINIYSKGRTLLGQMLSNFGNFPVDLEDGTFQSLEGYWYWLLSPKNENYYILKKLYGFKAKEMGKKLKLPDWPSKIDEDFKTKFKLAMREK